ncbi:hypothetical protein QYE76_050340 [Lolium multiflorum]|uniref:Uncharacterized protein n=1 Tax=Lolium multiflorum TaxID=4521 RepID=A0AAD8SRG6_LOLMU|nr:hypothetical protein QYE76_050340 [Lolium multiflorum]
MKPPTTKKELQRLIGKINFVRRFISNLSGRIEPFMGLIHGQLSPNSQRKAASRCSTCTSFKPISTYGPSLIRPKSVLPLPRADAGKPEEAHAANIRRAIEAGDEPSHDFSTWSEDDQSLTDGESDLSFLAREEAVEESDDDHLPWDGAPSSEEERPEEEEEDDSSSDEPPAKRHCPWPGNLSDFDSDDDDADEEDEDNEGPAGGRYSSDDEPAGSSADDGDDGDDDEGSNGP